MAYGTDEYGTVPYGGATFSETGMAWGSASVQVAFQNNPYDSSLTWTDITKYVTGFNTSMGRQHELQQVAPSQATITLSNQTGRFSPWNTGSPYYYSGTGLTVGHPVRILASPLGSSTVYPVYYGYTKGWVPTYGITKASMTLQCYDVLALLNLDTLDINTYSVYPTAHAAYYWQLNDSVGAAAAQPTNGGVALNANGPVTFGQQGPLISVVTTAASVAPSTNLSPASSITLSGTTLSMGCWFNSTTPNTEILTTGSGAGMTTNGSGYPTFHLSPFSAITGTWSVCDGAWHYIIGTYDGANGRLFVDGIQVGSAAGTLAVSDNFVGVGTHVGTAPPTMSADVAQVEIYTSAISATTIANQYQLGSAGFVVQDTGSRINAILNNAGFPAGLNNVGTGTITIQAASSSLASTTAMSYINQVVSSERGLFYQDANGVLQFRNRNYVYTNTSSNTSNATFGYASGQYHYFSSGLVPGLDDLDLWNNITVSRANGLAQNAADSGSQTSFGRRTLTGYTNLLFTDDTASSDLAQGLLYQYSQPAPRIRSLSMDSTISNGANMPQMLGRQLLDRIAVNWRPLDGSSVDFSQQSLIEQVSHTVTPETWTTTFAVTPVGTEPFLVLDSATQGILDTNTLGF